MAEYQPTKLAAMESQWNTVSSAPFYLLELPQPKAERNSIEALPIPNMLSLLSYHSPTATVKGLLDFPADQRPPVAVAFWSFRIMVALGFLFVLLALLAVIFAWKDSLAANRWFLWIMPFALILPYVPANSAGSSPRWVASRGCVRLVRTKDAVSRSITAVDVLISLIGFILIYGFLAAVDAYLLAKYARKIE